MTTDKHGLMSVNRYIDLHVYRCLQKKGRQKQYDIASQYIKLTVKNKMIIFTCAIMSTCSKLCVSIASIANFGIIPVCSVSF